MKLIVGLGNPGAQYEKTRHNVGFHVVDTLAEKYGMHWERRGRAMIANGIIKNEKIVLIKPLTYMNNSGEAVGELVRWFKIDPEDLLVVYDDLDLPVGHIRMRPGGSAGGHNGMKSIIQHLHTDQFPRMRIGIGRPKNVHIDTINHVLGMPTGDEQILLATGEDKVASGVELYLQEGLEIAMNHLNVDPDTQQKAEAKRQRRRERIEQKHQHEADEQTIQATAQANEEHVP